MSKLLSIKVGFDISQIAHGGGVGTYTREIASKLSERSELEMVFFYSLLRKRYKGKLKNVREFYFPPTLLEWLFNRLRKVPIEKFIGEVDVFHSSDWMQPPTRAKKVTTYHDVIPLKYPKWSDPRVVNVHKRRLEIVEREVDRVIAVSNTTKEDLVSISKIPANKIEVIYEAAGENFRSLPIDEVERFRNALKLPDRFVLAIGGVGQRRNLERIKEACRKVNCNLVITGENIRRLSDKDMPLLYNSASVLAYVSLYEGFGLPLLEAMKCDLPIVTSNISSTKEIVGNAGLLVDPQDTSEIAKKIEMLLEDGEVRNDLINNGRLQASKFSWERAADETERVYESLYTSSSIGVHKELLI